MAAVDEIETTDLVLIRRKAYPNAASQGRGVVEMQPKDPKAIDELVSLSQIAFR